MIVTKATRAATVAVVTDVAAADVAASETVLQPVTMTEIAVVATLMATAMQ